jgi:ankyrin repeat protein
MSDTAMRRGKVHVRQLRQRGLDDARIREQFRKAGWRDHQIDELLGVTRPPACPYCGSNDVETRPKRRGFTAWLEGYDPTQSCKACGLRWGDEGREYRIRPRWHYDRWLASRLRVVELTDSSVTQWELAVALALEGGTHPSHCEFVVADYCARHSVQLEPPRSAEPVSIELAMLDKEHYNPLLDGSRLEEALGGAAAKGDAETVALLIASGVSPAAGYPTPLHEAAEHGCAEIVELLLEHAGGAITRDQAGLADDEEIWLGSSTDGGHRALSAQGHPVVVDARGPLGRTPLHEAADNGHLSICRMLLERGAPADSTDDQGVTPLHDAASCGHPDVCRLLLEHGAKAASRDADGCTPLHLASGSGLADICRALLKAGAPVDVVSRREHSKPRYVSWVDDYSGETQTHLDGFEAAVVEKRTPLHYAAEGGHLEIVKLLLERNARPDIEDGYGESAWDIALHYAQRGSERHEQTLELLRPGEPG